MLRATKFLSVCFFVALAFANVGQVQAQATYEVGPFMAIGIGETETQAEENAYAEAWDIVDAMASSLPEGHVIIDFVIEYQDYFANSYLLEFHLLVEYTPTPPGGGKGPFDPPG